MSNQLNQSIRFSAIFYDLDGNVKTDLTVNVTVEDVDGTTLVASTAATLRGSRYEYALDGASVDAYGCYTAVFEPTVITDVVPPMVVVVEEVVPWLTNLDATISSRLPTSSYSTPPSVSAIRSEIDTNSTKLDVAVGTRLASAGYTTPPNTTQIQAVVEAGLDAYDAAKVSDLPPLVDVQAALTAQGYTEERSLLLDNLDEAISGLPSPLDATQTAAAVQTGLTAQGYTTTRAGFLDTLNGLVTAIWNYADRSFTSFATAVTLNLRQLVPDVPVVNPYLLHLVYGDSYSFNDGRSLGWQFSEAQCPVLTEADVPRLKFINLNTDTVVLNITGTAIDGTRQVYFEPTATNMQIGDNTGDLQLAFEVSITRPSTNIITPIPASKGKAVVYRSV